MSESRAPPPRPPRPRQQQQQPQAPSGSVSYDDATSVEALYTTYIVTHEGQDAASDDEEEPR